jgi:tetratricopeptide (TPR) repeat protein
MVPFMQAGTNRLGGANDAFRADLADRLREIVDRYQLTIVVGAPGLGQVASIQQACRDLAGWNPYFADGCWLTGGYLAGLHELIAQVLTWAETSASHLVARHEQSLKRIWPTRQSTAYRVPKDLTNIADREERTRFYHYEYQNKLLVGLAEFLLDALCEADCSVLLVIDNAGRLSPTVESLIGVLTRLKRSIGRIRFILLDHGGTLFLPEAVTVSLSAYTQEEFERHLNLAYLPGAQRELIYGLSGGNLRVGRAIAHCIEYGINTSNLRSPESIIDLYLAAVGFDERRELARRYLQNGFVGDMIAQRNAETIAPSLLDVDKAHLHEIALQKYRMGDGPLVLAYALAMSDKSKRIETLVEPCEILMGIGLYDTWFSFFLPMFADPDLRAYGDGNGLVNGLFINAAFVLYAMGNVRVSTPFIEEALERFPDSRFVPTALYAQSMTYGRYQIPVDLERAEACATTNLRLIDERFRGHQKYSYIKVFAENAYAYIKARQGKFSEALSLCERGNVQLVEAYGSKSYKLHRSILIYNTGQIYELIGDYARAEAQLNEAIECDPYYGEYHNDLGNLLSRIEGREREAFEAYARAIALSPPYYEAHLNRGIMRAQTGDRSGALRDFERVLEIKPQEWRAMREIGNLMLENGNAAGARNLYNRALTFDQQDADLQANAGLACSEMGDSDQAIRHYQLAIALKASHAAAHNNLAAELLKQGRYDQAREHVYLAAKFGDDPDFDANRATIDALCAAESLPV